MATWWEEKSGTTSNDMEKDGGKKNPGKRDKPAGLKSGAQPKAGLVDKTKLYPYVPHGKQRIN